MIRWLAMLALLAGMGEVRAQAFFNTQAPPDAPYAATGSTTGRTRADRALDPGISILDLGAKCDLVRAFGTAVASSASYGTNATFTAADVGKLIVITGAGTGGNPLVTTLAAVSAGTGSATLNTPAVVAASGSLTYLNFITTIGTAQSGAGSYAPGDTITLTGGTAVVNAILTVSTTQVVSATIAAAGSGGTNGTATVTGTTGTGTRFTANVTIAGGLITAVNSITTGGIYTANPTTLATEPVAGTTVVGVAGNGLTGAQLAVKTGPFVVAVTSPGSYSANPANPVSQGSTSGSGTGFTVNATFSAGGGFFYASDDTTPIQNAINLAATNRGAFVRVPSLPCAISSTLTIANNGVGLGSTGAGATGHDVGSQTQAASLVWAGAPGGTMLSIFGASSGSAQYLTGISVRGLSLISDGLAGIGLQAGSVRAGEFTDLYEQEFTTAGYDFTSTLTLGEGTSSQGNMLTNLNGRQILTNGNILRIGANASSTPIGNFSMNTITNLRGQYRHGNAIECVNADNNVFVRTALGRVSTGVGLAFEATADAGGTCRDMDFYHFTGGFGSIALRGTETSQVSAPVSGIILEGLDLTNSDPLPTIGVGVKQWLLLRGDGSILNGAGISQLAVDKYSALGAAQTWHAANPFPAGIEVYSDSQLQMAFGNASTRCFISISSVGDYKIAPNANCARVDYTAMGVKFATRIVTAAGAITMGGVDFNVCANKTVGAATVVNLPAGPPLGQDYTIADCKGDAATNNITVTPAAGNIDGSATFVISTNFGSWTGYYTGTIWKTRASR